MEGVMVSVFTGVMKSLITKLANLLEKNYELIEGVDKDLASLKDEMSSMNALLVKMSEMEELDVQQKEWRDKVRELGYDMEDCVDTFMQKLDHGDASAGRTHRLRMLKARRKFASRIKDLKARAVEVSNYRKRYNESIPQPGCSRAVRIDPRLPAIHADATSLLVGIDGQKEKLVGLLKEEQGAQQLKVVSLVGEGGIGKTTLATQVYTAIKRQYDCTAFVSVSRNPDMVKILSDILIGVGSYPFKDDVDQLIGQLKKRLEDKRYLIVIDDIWTAATWDIIKCCFVENNRGSRVITTTRDQSVAKTCCSRFHGHGHVVYSVCCLEVNDSRKLFHRRVFDSEDACPEKLHEVSDEILKKCGGMPLAILTVASILSSREEVKLEENWETIKHYLSSQSERNPDVRWMRHVLNLGYIDLSLDLKKCMLYLSIFPEDSEIMKDDLMRRWIAEGFISEKYTCGPEETAEMYFNELIERNMIQIAEFDDCGEVKSCRMHDMMLDFIISKSKEENLMTLINDQHRTKGPLEVRRLSVQVKNLECDQVLSDMALTQARSFKFWGPAKGMPSLSKFRLLRVLHLDVYYDFFEDKQFDLSCICRLFQLRYLRIRGIWSLETLTQLQKLQHLETLNIEEGGVIRIDVRELPSSLLHLIVPRYTKLLGGIGRMRALRTLATLQLQDQDVEIVKGIGELDNVRVLELDCYSNAYDSLLPSLCKLGICNLRYLTIRWFLCRDALSCWSPSPLLLRRLHVLGCPISMLPDWMAQLDKLRSLEVDVRSLSRDGVEVLATLPSLVHLRLHVGDVPEEGVVICGTAFRNLREFWFRCKVPCLTFEAGAMQRLNSLKIDCHEHGVRQADDVLVGVEHLGSLRLFEVDIYELDDFMGRPHGYLHVEELPTWDESSLEAALRKAISKHPGSPDISIRSVGRTLGLAQPRRRAQEGHEQASDLRKIMARPTSPKWVYIPIPMG